MLLPTSQMWFGGGTVGRAWLLKAVRAARAPYFISHKFRPWMVFGGPTTLGDLKKTMVILITYYAWHDPPSILTPEHQPRISFKKGDLFGRKDLGLSSSPMNHFSGLKL